MASFSSKPTASHSEPPALPELLAPAGSPAAGYAALQYGADAVYLGLPRFSARAEADNFTPDALRDFVGWAHTPALRRRVYVTINTVVQQREFPALLDTLAEAAVAGVDAIIVQDLGILDLIRTHFPTLSIHASTQMAIHNRAGAETLRRLGARRVTLARELVLDAVRDIASLPGMETEVFIHGSLCYGYSGLCFFSSMVTGRSANRGRCAYPCRGLFTLGEQQGHAFSMKDLALPDYLPALRAAGVTSLKIEGRKKSPLYVASAVQLYRGLLDGTLNESAREQAEQNTRLVFSRPWTRFFVDNADRAEPIETKAVGHLGVEIGTVEAVCKRGQTHTVRFTLSHPLERHDGLQLLLAGESIPFGFAVKALHTFDKTGRMQNAFSAEAGETVEVELPPGQPVLTPGTPVYHSSSQRVKNAFPVKTPRPGEYAVRAPVTFTCHLSSETLRVQARVDTFFGVPVQCERAFPGPWEAARNLEAVQASFEAGFSRLGNTPFRLESLVLENPDGCFASASRINAMRRELIQELEIAYQSAQRARMDALLNAVEKAPAETSPAPPRLLWSLKIDRVAILDAFEAEDLTDVEEVVLDIGVESWPVLEEGIRCLADRFGQERIRMALPILCRETEQDELMRRIEQLRLAGWTRWEIGNVWGWTALGLDPTGPIPSRETLDLRTDWSLYALNNAAIAAFRHWGADVCALSSEDDGENIRRLLRQWRECLQWIVFQDTPLFFGEACPRAALRGGCSTPGACGEEAVSLRDGGGKEYLALQRNCRTILLGHAPLSLARFVEKLRPLGLARVRADFLYRSRSPEEVLHLWRQLRQGHDPSESHSGNYTRGLA